MHLSALHRFYMTVKFLLVRSCLVDVGGGCPLGSLRSLSGRREGSDVRPFSPVSNTAAPPRWHLHIVVLCQISFE